MVTKPETMISLSTMRDALESLRTSLIDVEALANCAEGSLQQVPYLPRLPQGLDNDTPLPWSREERRTFGRVQALVSSTAQAAENALSEFEDLLRELSEEDDDGDDGSDDDGNGDDGNGPDPDNTPNDAAGALSGSIPEHIDEMTTLPRTRAGILLDTLPPYRH